MARITLKGKEIDTVGELPAVGSAAPDFVLVGRDFSPHSLAEFRGKKVVLNIFPSIDTPICAASVRHFNQEAASLPDTAVLCISADLPFAHDRFCEGEGIDNVLALSVFRTPAFGEEYGVRMENGAIKGLLARAVVVVDAEGRVAYNELVSEIGQEPDYAAALAAL